MSHAKHIGLIQGTAGGILAGIALSNSGGLLMLFALSLLWPASKYPLAGSVWGGLAVLISHRWILGLHPLTWIGIPTSFSLFFTVLIWLSCALFREDGVY